MNDALYRYVMTDEERGVYDSCKADEERLQVRVAVAKRARRALRDASANSVGVRVTRGEVKSALGFVPSEAHVRDADLHARRILAKRER
jgi:hypothetical protein